MNIESKNNLVFKLIEITIIIQLKNLFQYTNMKAIIIITLLVTSQAIASSHTRILARGAPVTPSTETPTEIPGLGEVGG